MKISVLCVTHERPEFIPWLLWNFSRLNWSDKELVVIDSSEKSLTKTARKGIDHYHHTPGANVPAKRNMAMRVASGDFITWLDDDDWRHPEWANAVTPLITNDTRVAGGRATWFVNLFEPECRRWFQRSRVLFASVLVDTAVAQSIPFNEGIERGSDIDWMDRLFADSREFAFTFSVPSMFLCHDRNMGNTHFAHHFNRPLADAEAEIGKKAWGDTSKQIEALAKRLS